MIPLPNFATYPMEKYSTYNELINLPNIPFTSLNIPEYYKWWNIKALVKFKWSTYGRRYYFAIWIFYTIFLCCFAIVVTIPQSKISLSNQLILLKATIVFGFLHLTFEVRQFIHDPISYISSPWNWFGIYIF